VRYRMLRPGVGALGSWPESRSCPKARQRTDISGLCGHHCRIRSEKLKNTLATFTDAGSFAAGLLIGVSILIPVFAMMVAEPGEWQALWLFGAPTVLALGFLLQAVVIARLRHVRTDSAKLQALRIRFWG
jgi:hypothetical protein